MDNLVIANILIPANNKKSITRWSKQTIAKVSKLSNFILVHCIIDIDLTKENQNG